MDHAAVPPASAGFSYQALSQHRSALMGIAMVLIMSFHAYNLEFPLAILETIQSLGFGGVDIFIMLSCIGLVMSLDRREQSYGAFMAKRLERLLPGYYCVMIPYTLFRIFAQEVPWSTLFWNITLLSYWLNSDGRFNWYVSGILFYYLITPPVYRFLKKSTHRELWVTVAVLGSFAFCQVVRQVGYWYYLDVFYRFGIFAFGILLGLYIVEEKPFTKKIALFWWTWAVIGLFYFKLREWGYGGPFQVGPCIVYLHACHLFLFTSPTICLAAAWCFDRLPLGWIERVLGFMGKHSFGIYLLNVTVATQTELLQNGLFGGLRNLYYYPILWTLNILLGALLSIGLTKLTAFCKAKITHQTRHLTHIDGSDKGVTT